MSIGRYQAYPENKDSGVEWLGTVPTNWRISRVKIFAALNSSKSELNHLPRNTEVTFLPMEAIGEQGELDASRTKLLSEVSSGYTYLAEGDVCIAKITPCFENGKGAIVNGLRNGIAFATTEVIPFRCGSACDSRFLYHLLTSPPFNKQAEGSMYGAGGQKRVADSFVANYHFSVPSLPEQTQIAAFLDHETAKIDRLIEQQQELIRLLKEKRQAVISHAVTKGLNPHVSAEASAKEEAPLKDSGIEWLGDIPDHWAAPPFYVRYEQALGKMLDQAKMTGAHPTPYLRNLDVRWDYFSEDELPMMDIRPEEKERFTVRRGDILMVEGRELGRCAIWDGDDDVIGFQKALHRLRPRDPSEEPRFFYYTMVFVHATGAFMANQQPNEIPHLTGEKLRQYRFPKPPHAEQVAIVRYLDDRTAKLDTVAASAQRAVTLLQERRTALISAAVTGKIDVRHWQPPVGSEMEQAAAHTG